MLEVLLASLIFVISIAGIFGTLTYVRKPVANRQGALAAAVFGKQVLEALRAQVSMASAANYYSCSVVSSSCPDFGLSLGLHSVSIATLAANGLTWPPALTANNINGNPAVLNYTVICADGSGCANTDIGRRVDLNINWQ